MALQRSAKKKRRYISKDWRGSSATLFLVYVYDPREPVLKSDGPYQDHSKAESIMYERLREGVCSWIVSYDG